MGPDGRFPIFALSGVLAEHPVAGKELRVRHQSLQAPNEKAHVCGFPTDPKYERQTKGASRAPILSAFPEATSANGWILARRPCFSNSCASNVAAASSNGLRLAIQSTAWSTCQSGRNCSFNRTGNPEGRPARLPWITTLVCVVGKIIHDFRDRAPHGRLLVRGQLPPHSVGLCQPAPSSVRCHSKRRAISL